MEVSVTILTLAIAFIVAILIAPFTISFLRRLKFGQSIREEGPKSHFKKTGTPTMGGVIFIIAALVAFFATGLYLGVLSPSITLILIAFLGYAIIGLLDDSTKIFMKQNLGLTPLQKIVAQLAIAVAFFLLYRSLGLSTEISIPMTDISFDLGWLYGVLVLLMLVAASNAVNLTDGLDGLATGTAAIAYGAFAIIAISQNQVDIAIFCIAIVGALLGFLVFNANPAKIFMGDTGSLALGGALAAVAIALKQELILIIIGAVFLMETLSVIIQVISFKTTGKRVFRMSPIHHHFELGGWSEWRVDATFWFVGLICAVLGIIIAI